MTQGSSTVGRILVARAGVLLTRVALRTAGFAATIRALSALPRVLHARHAPDPRWAGEIATADTARLGGTCLDRSVALWFTMRQHGLDGDLRIGVARNGDTLDAHAWVEYGGAVLNDTADVSERFAVFDDDPTDLVFT